MRAGTRRAAALAWAALAAIGLTGCASSGGHGAAAAAASPAAVVAPVVQTPPAPLPCDAGSGLALPAGWPTRVPLPPGLLVTRTERRSGDRLIAYGRVRGDFHEVVRFFDRQLATAGFTSRDGQLDPFDAESDFLGPTLRGRWTTGLSSACPGHADVTVLVLPATAAPGSPSPD